MAFNLRGLGVFCGVVYSLPSFPIACLYLLMVCFSGLWQKHTKPLNNLRPILLVYNVACCLISVYTTGGFIYVLATMDKHLHDWKPVPELQPFMLLYYYTKILELLDTVFMVVRHKSRQVSFLHVYHHASMLLLTDYTGQNTFWPAICFLYCNNAIIHIFLYFYYGYTAWYPNKRITWKHCLTEIQLVQFGIDLVFAIIGYIYYDFCIYVILYLFTMIGLFSNFYIKAYFKPKSTTKPSHTNGSLQQNGYHRKSETNGVSPESNGTLKHEINGNLKIKYN